MNGSNKNNKFKKEVEGKMFSLFKVYTISYAFVESTPNRTPHR